MKLSQLSLALVSSLIFAQMSDADTSSDMKIVDQMLESKEEFDRRYKDVLLESRKFMCSIKAFTALSSEKGIFKETVFPNIDGQDVTIEYAKKLVNYRYYSEQAPDQFVTISESKITSNVHLTKTTYQRLSEADSPESTDELFSLADHEDPLLVRLVRYENNNWFGEYAFRLGSSSILAGLACQMITWTPE